MNMLKHTLKPASTFLAVLLVLNLSFCQSVSAAMIGTEAVLQPDCHQKIRNDLHDLISRERIRQTLVERGIGLQEAKARIDSLSDAEIEQISELIADLPAGGTATGFIVVVGAVILILIIIIEYASPVKMFPQFHSNN